MLQDKGDHLPSRHAGVRRWVHPRHSSLHSPSDSHTSSHEAPYSEAK